MKFGLAYEMQRPELDDRRVSPKRTAVTKLGQEVGGERD